MDGFDDILRNATASIPAKYFHLPVAQGYKLYERVYAYEFYHQLRCEWRGDHMINGELNKTNHPWADQYNFNLKAIPDFVVHKPGSMEDNYAVIEIKRPGSTDARIRTDLTKLIGFKTRFRYQRSIFYMFGVAEKAEGKATDQIVKVFSTLEEKTRIELWNHRESGKPAHLIGTIE